MAFSEYNGLVPATEKDSDGAVRQTLRPSFTNYRALCYPCYKSAVIADLARFRSGRR
jgi:hypothetical protein